MGYNPQKSMLTNIICFLLLCDIVFPTFLFLSLNKALYVPSQRYSKLQLIHDFTKVETNLFNIEITLNITQTSLNNQTNSVFDILYASKANQTQFLGCYNRTVQFINEMYSQYKPCKQIYNFNSIETFKSEKISQEYSEIVGNLSYPEGEGIWIIDNTFYPCFDGAYQPQLYLQELINVSIQENKLFLSLIQIICVVLLQVMIISMAYLIIMTKKYKKIKSDFEKLKSQHQAQELLDSFLQDNREKDT